MTSACYILTKSCLITRDIDLLSCNTKNKICFTVTPLDNKILRKFELTSPYQSQRIESIRKLKNAGIDVYAHVGPLMPGLFDIRDLYEKLKPLGVRVDFEIYHFNADFNVGARFIEPEWKIFTKEKYYSYWQNVCSQIDKYFANIEHKIHLHSYDDYFKNVEGQYI